MADGSRFELERAGDATAVRVVMPAPEVPWEERYDEIREGWTSFVLQLRFALERHSGEDRRAFRLVGNGEPPSAPPAATGGEASWGEQLHRNEHQTALTVDEYGPGLVIVHGAGTAIVTTYGLDDEAVAALERRWRDSY